MSTLRDGGSFFEAGGAAGSGDGGPAEGQAPPEGRKGFNFRTGDELPIGRSPARAPSLKADDSGSTRASPRFREPALSEVFVPAPVASTLVLHSLTLLGDGDLAAAGRALDQANVKAWITVASPSGPVSVDLVQFLRLRGLA